MKIIMTLLMLMLATSALASEVKLQWDANDPAEQVTRYNIYMDGAKNISVNAPATTATILNVNGNAHSFYVTATNEIGESAPSNTVTMPPMPKAVKNLKISITFDVTVP